MCHTRLVQWDLFRVPTLGNLRESYGRHYAVIGTVSLYKL